MQVSAATVARSLSPQSSATGARGGVYDIARRIWRTEGLRGFYVGLGPTLARGLALDVIQFSAADLVRGRLHAKG